MKKILHITILFIAQFTIAQSASLDTSFNTGTGFYGSASVTKIQSDGKILVGGIFTEFNGITKTGIVRLNNDGSIDNTFNVFLIYDNINGTDPSVSSMAIASDGKIVIAGGFTSINGLAINGLARLNNDGSLDTSFNPGTGVDPYYGHYFKVLIQPDGKILLGGLLDGFFNAINVRGLVRLNTDGSIDSSFNLTSIFNVDTITGNYFTVDFVTVSDIKIQSDNSILIAGSLNVSKRASGGSILSFANYNIIRLDINGNIDLSFFPPNTLDINYYTQAESGPLTCLDLQLDGKIVIGGLFSTFNGVANNNICRLNTDGSIDASFTIGSGVNDIVRDILILPNDKIMIGGQFSQFSGTTRQGVARLNSNGTLDLTFEPIVGLSNQGYVNSISRQSDGKIILGGGFTTYDNIVSKSILRLNGDALVTNNFNIQANFKLYPNPVCTSFTIQTPNNINLTKVIITDTTGKVVLEQTQNITQVNVEQLASGMYIVQAFSGVEQFTSKFVKE